MCVRVFCDVGFLAYAPHLFGTATFLFVYLFIYALYFARARISKTKRTKDELSQEIWKRKREKGATTTPSEGKNYAKNL